MVRPYQESEHGDANAGHGNEAVAKHPLARKAGDDLGDHAHGGQDHDVHRGVRVEPEQVLEEQWIAAADGIENSELEDPFEHHEQQRDRQHRRAQQLDDAGSVVRPDEQRQSRPGHSWRTHTVNCYHKIQSGQNGGESRDEDGDSGFYNAGVTESCAEGRVEGPAGIDTADHHGVQHDDAGDHEEVPTQQIDPGEGQVFGANHQWHQKVSQHGGDRRDQEEEDHHLAVLGEELVVRICLDEITRRSQQFETD